MIYDLDDVVVIDGVKLEKRKAEPQAASDDKAASPHARLKAIRDAGGRGRYKPK